MSAGDQHEPSPSTTAVPGAAAPVDDSDPVVNAGNETKTEQGADEPVEEQTDEPERL